MTPPKSLLQMRWMPCPLDKRYSVSEYGHVKFLPKNRILKQHTTPKGYLYVSVKRTINTHRLVLMTFRGSPPTPKHQAAHIDGDKTNNHISNLKWVTQRENEEDKKRHGTYLYGDHHPASKLTTKDVVYIRRNYRVVPGAYATQPNRSNVKELAKKYGVSASTIYAVMKMVVWDHV